MRRFSSASLAVLRLLRWYICSGAVSSDRNAADLWNAAVDAPSAARPAEERRRKRTAIAPLAPARPISSQRGEAVELSRRPPIEPGSAGRREPPPGFQRACGYGDHVGRREPPAEDDRAEIACRRRYGSELGPPEGRFTLKVEQRVKGAVLRDILKRGMLPHTLWARLRSQPPMSVLTSNPCPRPIGRSYKRICPVAAHGRPLQVWAADLAAHRAATLPHLRRKMC
jgi:hypothetical protein